MIDVKKLLTKILTGFVDKTGDVMTGILRLKDTLHATGDSVPSGSWGPSYLLFRDKNDWEIGRVAHIFNASGTEGMYFRERRVVNGSEVINQLGLIIDGSGDRTVSVSDAGAWRDALDIGIFQHVASNGTGSSSSRSWTHTLVSGGVYLLIASRTNAASNTYSGLYIIQAHTGSSSVKAVSAASQFTVSISALTLSVSASTTYSKYVIYRVY